MSIIKTRSFLEKSGCGWFVSIACGVVMLFSIFMTRGCNKDGQGDTIGKKVVFSVADSDFSILAVDMVARQLAQQTGRDFGNLEPSDKAKLYGQTIAGLIQNARIVKIGEEAGIKLSDKEIVTKNDEVQKKSLERAYANYVQMMDSVKTASKEKKMTFQEFEKWPLVAEGQKKNKELITEFMKSDDTKTFLKGMIISEMLVEKYNKGKKDEKDQKIALENMMKAQSELDKKITDSEKKDKIEWKDASYRLAYELTKAAADPKKLKAIALEAEKNYTGGKSDNSELSALVFFSATDDYTKSPEGKKDTEFKKTQIAAYQAVLTNAEDFGLRLKLVDLLTESKEVEKAVTELKSAASMVVTFDKQGEEQIKAITDRLKKLDETKLLSSESKASIEKEIKIWQEDKAKEDKDKAEALKEQKEIEKQEAADKAKWEKEEKEAQKKEGKSADSSIKKPTDDKSGPEPKEKK